MSTAQGPEAQLISPHPSTSTARPDRVILVYDGDSGLRAMLLDVVKKAAGREECALCEITYGPLGKRGAWRECEARLGVIVDELHRDQLPPEWAITREALPCVLGRVGTERPFVLLSKGEIEACGKRVDELDRKDRRRARGSRVVMSPATPTIAENAKGALERVCSGAGLDAPSRYYAAHFVDHVNDLELRGLEGAERSVALYRALLSNMTIEVEEQHVAGDRVTSRFVVTGMCAGRRVRFNGITISRFESGLIAEDWSVTDALGMLRQLGLARSLLVGARSLRALRAIARAS